MINISASTFAAPRERMSAHGSALCPLDNSIGFTRVSRGMLPR